MSAELVHVPFHGTTIEASRQEDDLWIVFRPVVESLGLDYSSQLKRIRRSTWASCGQMTTTGADGKQYDMVTVNRRTLTMWLATVQVNSIREDLRPLLRQYQSESADVLDSYWHEGGAINPRATVEQADALTAELGRIKQRAEIVQALRGVVANDYLDAKGRILLAQAMGETPQLDPAGTPLYVWDYLDSRGLSKSETKAVASNFGKLLRAAYFVDKGDQPPKAPQDLGGRIVQVYAYTERDRYLFDRVWIKHYADTFSGVSA